MLLRSIKTLTPDNHIIRNKILHKIIILLISDYYINTIEDYKIVKKILDHLGIYEFGKKRSPPKINTYPDDFDEYIIDDYIDCDHVC